jgi:hypothetical protein
MMLIPLTPSKHCQVSVSNGAVRTVERRSIPGQSKYPSSKALVSGGVYMAAVITYGAIRTHGFHAELVTFEVPLDLE